jgi:hypothetical protein
VLALTKKIGLTQETTAKMEINYSKQVMKIRPDKFSMDFDDFDINQAKALGASLVIRPVAYLDLQNHL